MKVPNSEYRRMIRDEKKMRLIQSNQKSA